MAVHAKATVRPAPCLIKLGMLFSETPSARAAARLLKPDWASHLENCLPVIAVSRIGNVSPSCVSGQPLISLRYEQHYA